MSGMIDMILFRVVELNNNNNIIIMAGMAVV